MPDHFIFREQMLLSRLQNVKPSRELQRLNPAKDFDRSYSNSGVSRPASAATRGKISRPGSAANQRAEPSAGTSSRGRRRPQSAATNSRKYSDDDFGSRPATRFARRPDDDDILTWNEKL